MLQIASRRFYYLVDGLVMSLLWCFGWVFYAWNDLCKKGVKDRSIKYHGVFILLGATAFITAPISASLFEGGCFWQIGLIYYVFIGIVFKIILKRCEKNIREEVEV